MNTQIFSIIGFSVLVLFTSCKECVTCDNCPDGIVLLENGSDPVESKEYCKGAFQNRSDFGEQINSVEEVGCSCE